MLVLVEIEKVVPYHAAYDDVSIFYVSEVRCGHENGRIRYGSQLVARRPGNANRSTADRVSVFKNLNERAGVPRSANADNHVPGTGDVAQLIDESVLRLQVIGRAGHCRPFIAKGKNPKFGR